MSVFMQLEHIAFTNIKQIVLKTTKLNFLFLHMDFTKIDINDIAQYIV